MDPYRRDPWPARKGLPPPAGDDELAILWIAFFIGLLPVVVAVVRGADWGVEPTIGLFFFVLAGFGLLLRARDRTRGRRR